ncbi:SDR family oxidoreductase [Iocasia frigidifontis]|uniref:SDR family oxidoreductase n=1 Tax=Iocasia fonsfrigidae TaxID=2682810 RepID=A0A8A7KDW2_9FIRM|nr:SDR family NAD(P)-dependent oxidoreductase [Iocasia fonsfrigidae]QTL99450.1 SDR family oxidoreductase [Iocasia fonsfrigidae]
MKFKNMTVLITGGARGMGKAFAKEFASEGANVALCDVNKEQLEDTAAELRDTYKVKVFEGCVDVSNERQVNEFVESVESQTESIDILINNAAIHPLTPVEKISNEEWDKVLGINLKGYFLTVKAVLPGMRKKQYGRIINISSEAGKNGGTICALHYAASKGGVLAFTRNLAKQVGEEGITVNAIAPGRIATDMAGSVSDDENQIYVEKSAVKSLGKPADIANAVAFLASKRSNFVTGETININGGTVMD